MLEVVSVQMTPDGRSVVETVGRWRFVVEEATRHSDGYLVSDVRRLDDMSVAEEEALETTHRRPKTPLLEKPPLLQFPAASLPSPPAEDDTSSVYSTTTTLHELKLSANDNGVEQSHSQDLQEETDQDPQTMSTLSLFTSCAEFIGAMQTRSASWLRSSVISAIGPMPTDPAAFTWWFASVMPVHESEKYKLLRLNSVRERLMLCTEWAIQARDRAVLGRAGRGGGSGDMCVIM
jgi:hypothetical protein